MNIQVSESPLRGLESQLSQRPTAGATEQQSSRTSYLSSG